MRDGRFLRKSCLQAMVLDIERESRWCGNDKYYTNSTVDTWKLWFGIISAYKTQGCRGMEGETRSMRDTLSSIFRYVETFDTISTFRRNGCLQAECEVWYVPRDFYVFVIICVIAQLQIFFLLSFYPSADGQSSKRTVFKLETIAKNKT